MKHTGLYFSSDSVSDLQHTAKASQKLPKAKKMNVTVRQPNWTCFSIAKAKVKAENPTNKQKLDKNISRRK